MKTMKNPSSHPAQPTTHTRRMNNITPKMFWMQGKYTPNNVPNFADWKYKNKYHIIIGAIIVQEIRISYEDSSSKRKLLTQYKYGYHIGNIQ